MRSNQLSYRAIAAPKGSSLICECKGKAFSLTHQTFGRKNRSAKKDRPTARNRQPPASPLGQAKADRRRTDATVRQPNHQNRLPTCRHVVSGRHLCRPDNARSARHPSPSSGKCARPPGDTSVAPTCPEQPPAEPSERVADLFERSADLFEQSAEPVHPAQARKKAGRGTWHPGPALRDERLRLTYSAAT